MPYKKVKPSVAQKNITAHKDPAKHVLTPLKYPSKTPSRVLNGASLPE